MTLILELEEILNDIKTDIELYQLFENYKLKNQMNILFFLQNKVRLKEKKLTSLFYKTGENLPYILFKKINNFKEFNKYLSVRTMNSLNRLGIIYIGDLLVLTESEIFNFQGVRDKFIREIKAALNAHNLNLGMQFANWRPANIDILIEKYKDI